MSESTDLIIPDQVRNDPEALGATMVPDEAEEALSMLIVDSAPMYDFAGQELRDIVTRRKAIEDKRDEISAPLHRAHKLVLDFFRTPIERLTKVEDTIRGRMLTYHRDETERQRVAQVAQQKLADDAAKALADKAAELEKAAVAATDPAEAVRLAALADEQRAQADVVQHAVVARSEPVQTAGVGVRQNWKAEVLDFTAFLKYVADKPHYHYLLQVNEKSLGALAKSSKGTVVLDGVRFVNDGTISARRRT